VKRVKHLRKKPAFHNTALSAKVGLRRWLVEQLGGHPRILDCFCAAGMLWERAYDKTSNYVGLDLRQFNDERRTIVCDSLRYIRHADANLDQFDLFDLDAYGSPMQHFAAICHRIRPKPGRRIGFVITDGTDFNARMSGMAPPMLRYIGMARHKPSSVQQDYRHDILGAIMDKALKTAGLKRIEARVSENTANNGFATEPGGRMLYSAILAEGA
jgi:hypothetical protein